MAIHHPEKSRPKDGFAGRGVPAGAGRSSRRKRAKTPQRMGKIIPSAQFDFFRREAFLFCALLCSFILFGQAAAYASKKGVYHPVARGDTLYRISLAYKVPIAKILEANGISSKSSLKAGQRLFIPGAAAVLPVEPSRPLSPQERRDLEKTLESEEKPLPAGPAEKDLPPWHGKELDLIWPIQGKISSPFGPRGRGFHAGIDIPSPSYQEVKAAMDGEVVLARNSSGGYGKVVVLRHDLGFSTIYGHLNVIIAREGETVRQGQAIGGVGSTGRSTGPHLHFELRRKEKPLDPLPHLPMTIEELWENAAKKK
jgi:murein DD-endopeptidase MepM/ murein hydrolase activator NlpD